MDIKPGTPNGGSDRYNPQRGHGGYTPRQTTYYSSARPITSQQPVQTAINPTLEQSAQAAQRIVLPETLVAEPAPVVNYAGSFDMLAPPKPVPANLAEAKPIAQSAPVAPVIASLPIEPAPVQFAAAPAPVVTAPALPTDLKISFANEPYKQNLKKFGKFPKITAPKVLVGMAVCLFVAGVSISILSLRTNKAVVAQVKGASANSAKQDDDGGMTTGVPHEDGNPPSVEYYKTASTYPRVIRIPKNDTEARVLALGIAPTGALKAPGNIFDAGWYKDSARPGEAGAMVVDGHVSGPTKPGVFKNLGKLVKGDTIEIERGDGQKFIYTVQATKVFDADKLDMSSVMVSTVPGKPGLNIITCGGKFDKTTNKYEQRTVVYAVIN